MTVNTNENVSKEGAERCTVCRLAKCNNCLKYLVPADTNTYIRQHTPQGRLDGEYDTVLDAAEATGIHPNKILSALNGKNDTGYLWTLAGMHSVRCYVAESSDGMEVIVCRTKAELADALGWGVNVVTNAMYNHRAYVSYLKSSTFTVRAEMREVPIE